MSEGNNVFLLGNRTDRDEIPLLDQNGVHWLTYENYILNCINCIFSTLSGHRKLLYLLRHPAVL
jgi:hypothetical protein